MNSSSSFRNTNFSCTPHTRLVLLLERILHLLRVGRGRGHSRLVEILGHLGEFLKHLAALTLQLLAELVGLGHDGAHLSLELLLVLLGVGDQLRVLGLDFTDRLQDLGLDAIDDSVNVARVLLGLRGFKTRELNSLLHLAPHFHSPSPSGQ